MVTAADSPAADSSPHRQLYSLPQKQIRRAQRRQNYDKMKTGLTATLTASPSSSTDKGAAGANAESNSNADGGTAGGGGGSTPSSPARNSSSASASSATTVEEQGGGGGESGGSGSSSSSSSWVSIEATTTKRPPLPPPPPPAPTQQQQPAPPTPPPPSAATLRARDRAARASPATLRAVDRERRLVLPHDPNEIAALPLLRPFRIRRPEESSIVHTVINEQHAADTLAAVMAEEGKLRADLLKAQGGKDDKDERDERGGGKQGGSDKGKDGGKGGKPPAASGGGKRSKKLSRRMASDPERLEKVRELESQVEAASLAVHQCRQSLAQFAGWTHAMIQAEYSKIAVTLDPDSERCAELEECFCFLCPRPPGSGTDPGDAGSPRTRQKIVRDASGNAADEARHEQRIAYVREMIPVMRRAGERNFATSLVALPYLKKFQCDDPESPVVGALIDEMHHLAIAEGCRARLGKETSDVAKFRVLKHAEEALDRKEERTSDLVRKHYRKRSIKLHPDRNGEHMRPLFEEFTDARTVLSDVKLRQSYLSGMLDVFKYYGTAIMSESHDAWVRKHRPDKAESDVRRRGDNDGAGDEGGLRLEGGLHQQVPRGPMVGHRRDGKRHFASVSVRVPRPAHEFYARVRSIKVTLRDATDEKHVVELGREEIVGNIKFDRQGPILANEIPVKEMLLNPGHWEVFWYATLDTVGTDPLNPKNATLDESVTTRPSAIATFQVVDYDSMKRAQDFDFAENACKVIKGELSNTLHKLRTNQADSSSASERYGLYHQVLVRARKKCSHLTNLMKVSGRPSAVHDSLVALLAESRQAFAQLGERADADKKRKEKRGDARRFKAHIANVLESDDPLAWMKDVMEAELRREGGDVNRLYQLFFEGKGKYVLLVDSEMYKEASAREDIFSPKQCKDLAARAEEVAIQEAKEEEEAAAAEEKRRLEEEKLEKLRKEGELREKWAMVGQNARVGSLTSEKGRLMNNQLARILYFVVEKDRFEVQLYSSPEEKSYLKKENLTIYHGQVPKPKKNANVASLQPAPKDNEEGWNCKKCTFENDAHSSECSVCTNPRSKTAPERKKAETEANGDGKESEADVDKGSTEMSTDVSSEHKVDENDATCISDDASMKMTIFVRSTFSKKLTGKRGRKKKDLINRSGAEDIQIETSPIGIQVPVHLTGSRPAVLKAVALIQETIGIENVSEKLNKPPPPPPQPPVAPTPAIVSPPVLPTSVHPTVPAPIAPIAKAPVEKQVIAPQPTTNFAKNPMFPGFEKPVNATQLGVPISESGTQPTFHSFGDALLPRGLIDTTMSTDTVGVPPELPSEIGIRSQGMARGESITEASISSYNDRSHVSKTFTVNENDPLLVFLRSQQSCIKGSVEEYYIWLVKSEDIDSMIALKEAVLDEDYLNDNMKVGNGSSGLKGFKRKAFQRAVSECEVADPIETASQQRPSFHLPTNLFGSESPSPGPATTMGDPPEELVCPISLVLMTVDPVLASDGVTYERASIEGWLRTNMANIKRAQENLKWIPHSEPDQRVINNGIRSPAYGTVMTNITLTPNISVRNMARAYKERKVEAY